MTKESLQSKAPALRAYPHNSLRSWATLGVALTAGGLAVGFGGYTANKASSKDYGCATTPVKTGEDPITVVNEGLHTLHVTISRGDGEDIIGAADEVLSQAQKDGGEFEGGDAVKVCADRDLIGLNITASVVDPSTLPVIQRN